ncbi:MAG: hypothetical protein KC505_03385 [Myxococcales bacterium]|nr:hypothetical protein [Myxococcales bacterium]USN50690.1 MAG: hypothetical protein H6731_10605 [Myxococcales bacterium]
MFLIRIIIVVCFLFIIVIGCGKNDVKLVIDSEPVKTTGLFQINPEKQPDFPKNLPLEEHMKDNFDFSQFESVNWQDINTFGETCDCIGTSKEEISPYGLKPDFGITRDNYFAVKIAGDGSCWIRSATQVVLFHAFQSDLAFDTLINNIQQHAVSYAKIPGFSQRFRHHDLIALLKTLKTLSPKERLKQYNKVKVDLLLDYSMRALLHVRLVTENGELSEIYKIEAKKILTSKEWGDGSEASIKLAAMLLKSDQIFAAIHAESHDRKLDYLLLFYVEPRELVFLDFKGKAKIDSVNEKIKIDLARNYIESRETLSQVKEECRAKKADYEATPQENSSLRKQRRIEFYYCENFKLKVKQLAELWHLNSLADCHKNQAFRIFTYMPTNNHYELLIRNDAARDFGI